MLGNSNVDLVVLIVFGLVYLGMMVGRLPGLALDRTGAALLGAVALLGLARISPTEARDAVDVPTIGLLFGLMVVSAQFRLSGFYAHVTQRIASANVGPATLLGIVIGVTGLLSALLVNDIVVLAMTPMLVEGCTRRNLNPVPFLLAHACAANVGSAATLIGNPQNMLIGQSLNLSFAKYLANAGVPAALGLVVVWGIVAWQYRGAWHRACAPAAAESPILNHWQSAKGFFVLAALIVAFLIGPWPREVIALTGAGVLLLSRRLHTREMLGQVDWQLLVLFIALFVVNRAVADAGLITYAVSYLQMTGVDLSEPIYLYPTTVVLSNVFSNVPAVMMLLPLATDPLAGPLLALGSTLAGNLLIVGSIANIIVVDQAARVGVTIGWGTHARTGIPVTLTTLLIAALWLMVLPV